MKFCVLVCIAVAALARSAGAETAAELQARGEAAARSGDYAGAIESFKAADVLEVRANHACLIALAYTRRNLWPQAEIFRTLCHERARPDDPLPDWMAEADRQIDSAIAAANVAPLTIVVTPAEAAALVTVSSFAPDERFSPRVIHLSPGTHQIFASAPGFADAQQRVEIRDRRAQRIDIVLQPLAPRVARASRAPWVIVGAGVSLGVVGSILHATWYKRRYDAVVADVPGMEGDDIARWRTARTVVVGLYAASAVTIGTGLVLRTIWKHAPEVAVAPTAGGGIVSIGWQR